MKINAVLNGQVVTIGHIEFVGSDVFLAYTDSTGALLGTKVPFGSSFTSAGAFVPSQLATSGVILS